MASILMLGLENDLADQLSLVLRLEGHNVQTAESIEHVVWHRSAEIVFAGGDGPDYREVVTRLASARPDVPVVLVNRLPENSRWLDALELGAKDYCGAPFEAVQMRWLVGSVLRQPTGTAAAAA
jgi:DNA-binding NtrC family response regulator